LNISRPSDNSRSVATDATASINNTEPERLPGKGSSGVAGVSPGDPAQSVAKAGERRQLTILFCDLVGATALSTQLDPEDFAVIINAYRELCARVVARFDGFIAQYLGDGIMVYFGYPQAHEDDAERAVRAGLDIVRAISSMQPGSSAALQARIGIATGLVVVGGRAENDDPAREWSVWGEAPNLAARLQSLARPNAVLIGPQTRKLVGELFTHEDLGYHKLKGFAEPIPVWRIGGERKATGRFEAMRAATGLTSLVGREPEIERLQQCWRRVQEGRGQAVLLSGEAGIGKSRLLQVLREWIAAQPHTAVAYYCSPYHQNNALFPVIEQLEQAALLGREDAPVEKLDKLEALLAQSFADVTEVTPLFAALLSIPTATRYPPLDLSPQRLKQRIMAALIDRHSRLARREPLLLLVEDLHWIDPTTLELLKKLIQQLPGLPVLLAMAGRPEFSSPWLDDGAVTTLKLNRLDRRMSKELIVHLTEGKALPATVLTQIITKTDGMPLFIEEFTKSVLATGLLRDSGDQHALTESLPAIAVPETLRDSLIARLDRLGMVKEIAQLGATIGREFDYELLAAVSARAERSLQTALQNLLDHEVIRQRGTLPEAVYTFKHALIQEAAYTSLLRSQRQTLHTRIATVLEDRFTATAQARPELLAYHLTQAGLGQQAIPHWQQAGERASRRAAHLEATEYFTTALDLLDKLPASETRDRLELKLRVAAGVSLASSQGYTAPEVERMYRRARTLCRHLAETKELYQALRGLGTFNIVRGDLAAAREFSEQCLRIGQQTQDSDYLIEAYTGLGYSRGYMGEFEAARNLLEQVMKLYAARGDRPALTLSPQDPGVASLGLLAVLLCLLGYPDQALRRHEESIELAQRLKHPFHLAYAHTYGVRVHELRQEPLAAAEHAELGALLSDRHGFEIWSTTAKLHQGVAKCALGQLSEGIGLLNQMLAVRKAVGVNLSRPYFLAELAKAQQAAGQPSQVLTTIAEAFIYAEQNAECFFEAELYRLRGECIFALRSDTQAAVADCEQALVIARKQRAKWLELRAAISLYRLQRARGQAATARARLAELYGWFNEGFETADLQAAKALLAAA